MTEQTIQKKIIETLKSRGAYIVKVITASKAGVPDILACYKGVFVGIEVKKPDKLNTVTELQEYNLREIKKAGGVSIVMSSYKDVDKLVKSIESEKFPMMKGYEYCEDNTLPPPNS